MASNLVKLPTIQMSWCNKANFPLRHFRTIEALRVGGAECCWKQKVSIPKSILAQCFKRLSIKCCKWYSALTEASVHVCRYISPNQLRWCRLISFDCNFNVWYITETCFINTIVFLVHSFLTFVRKKLLNYKKLNTQHKSPNEFWFTW